MSANQKVFRFPDGTKSISNEEMRRALCTHDRVEFPGSVINLKIDFRKCEPICRCRELILDEGIISFSTIGEKYVPHEIHYNTPNSLIELDSGCSAPKVVCLSVALRKCSHLRGTEYLQAHASSDVRWFSCDNLRHYVLLGDKISNRQNQFDYISDGCVIHVESKQVALQVLKRCDVEKLYVVADADEWRDFPADKLALTAEQYNAESRILPEQIELRQQCAAKRQQEKEQKEEKKLQEAKNKKINDMSANIVASALQSVHAAFRIDYLKPDGRLPIYIQVVENIFSEGYRSYEGWNESLNVCLDIAPIDVAAAMPHLTELILGIRSLFDNSEFVKNREMRYVKNNNSLRLSSPIISLPLGHNGSLAFSLNMEDILKETKSAILFVKELNKLVAAAEKKIPGCNITLKTGWRN